jgi:hypothetical protein
MPVTIKVPGATQLLLVAADVNDQFGVFVVLVLATVSARVVSLSASAVMAAAPNAHCILVTTFERLIFQFGGQVS